MEIPNDLIIPIGIFIVAVFSAIVALFFHFHNSKIENERRFFELKLEITNIKHELIFLTPIKNQIMEEGLKNSIERYKKEEK